MLLLEGIGTIVFGLWVMSQGTGPGDSILILLGLPVVLFGLVLTFIGFAKAMKESAPDISEAHPEQPPENRGFVATFENDMSFADPAERKHPARAQKVREERARKRACPQCGAKYGLFDLVAQPTMCAQCWKKSKK